MTDYYIHEYINAIYDGKINVPTHVKRQYDLLIPILEGKDDRYYYNHKAALKPIDFAERFCRQSKGAWVGQPLELLLWQKAAEAAIYGILERETDHRKYKQVLIIVGKGNGKTTMVAPICLYETGRRGQENYCAANAVPQARIIWKEACNMLAQSPKLQKILKRKQYEIVNLRKDGFSFFTALSNSPEIMDGKMPQIVVLDEIHELQIALYDILARGQNKIAYNTLMFMLTTKGYVREQLFDSEYENSLDVLAGKVPNERKFSLLYELDNPSDWLNENNWIQANPSLNATITLENLREAVADGLAKPKNLNAVKVKHFNIGGISGESYFEYGKVHNSKTFSFKKFANCDAIGGFDLSLTNDLTAFCTTFWDRNEGEFCCEVMYWVSQDFYNKNVSDPRMGEAWRVWVQKGYVRIAGVNSINHMAIVDYVCEIVKKYNICYRYIYYDAYSTRMLITAFVNEGFSEGGCLVRCIQGAKTLSVPFQQLDAWLNSKKINYNNNPVTLWCITNVALRDADVNKNPIPEKAGRGNNRKIDGFATILNSMVGVIDHYSDFVE